MTAAPGAELSAAKKYLASEFGMIVDADDPMLICWLLGVYATREAYPALDTAAKHSVAKVADGVIRAMTGLENEIGGLAERTAGLSERTTAAAAAIETHAELAQTLVRRLEVLERDYQRRSDWLISYAIVSAILAAASFWLGAYLL